ncbi:hypothetical protein PLICRDRAFT_33846 [Plicaturopsis crispa FD-325 SS-3]|nr:hypothetical protein PLICRDRAFT_33846 [Plicaturopsis crispa FD-325 SS-3]
METYSIETRRRAKHDAQGEQARSLPPLSSNTISTRLRRTRARPADNLHARGYRASEQRPCQQHHRTTVTPSATLPDNCAVAI